jgi:hypothetical protein
MCALVLALRKIPIYAPLGGDAVLGSSDKPTYSVTVTDAEAAANREAFAQTKEGKRLVPSKKPEDPEPVQIPTKVPASSGFEATKEDDPATPSALRHRLSTLDETTALNTLNSRHPAADTANDPSDLIETDVPSSRSSTSHDLRRSADLEEVRGLLHRQSTRGKRKAGGDGPPRIPSLLEASGGPSMDIEYQTYPPQTLDPYLRQSGRHEVSNQQVSGPPQVSMPPARDVPRPIPGNGNAFAQQARQDQQQPQQPQQPRP